MTCKDMLTPLSASPPSTPLYRVRAPQIFKLSLWISKGRKGLTCKNPKKHTLTSFNVGCQDLYIVWYSRQQNNVHDPKYNYANYGLRKPSKFLEPSTEN